MLGSLLVDLLGFVASGPKGFVSLTRFALEAGVFKLAVFARLAQGSQLFGA